MDYLKNKDSLQLYCIKHKKLIQFIYLKNDYNSKLACTRCLLENKLDLDRIIEIEQLLEQKDETIFYQLPFGLSEQLYQQLVSKKIQEKNKEALIEQIYDQFNHFTESIVEALENHKKQLIMHVNSMENLRVNIIKTYNQVAYKQEIQQQIIQLQNNPQELDQYLKQFIQTKTTTQFQDNMQIEDSLKCLTNLTNQFEIEKMKDNLQSFLKKIQETSMLNQSELQQQHILQPLIKEKLNILSLSQLVSKENLNYYENMFLNLNSQSITDSQIKQVSNCIKVCNQLKYVYLDLKNNQIGDQGIKDLCQALECCSQVIKLKLHINQNCFSNIVNIQLAKMLQSYSNLQGISLRLSQNNIGDENLQSLFSVIRSQYNLNYLCLGLGSTNITEITVKQLCELLKSSSKLRVLKLDLAFNSIMDDDVKYLCDGLQSLSLNLNQLCLFLKGNEIGNQSVRILTDVIYTCSNLQLLELNLENTLIGCLGTAILQQFKLKIKQSCKNLKDLEIKS